MTELAAYAELGAFVSGGQSSYVAGLRAAVRALWSGVMTSEQATDAFQSAVSRGVTSAWYAGLKELGITPAEMSEEERAALLDEKIAQLTYAANAIAEMAQAVEDGVKLSTLMNRVSYWERAYGHIREKAVSLAETNPKMRWEYGDTIDHCLDCSRVAGRVYRKKTWDKYGWVPGSRELNCGGWQCDCRRVVTKDPVTPGRPPNMVGPG